MSERAKALEARSKSLRGYLYANMKRSGISEIKANDGSFTAKIKANPPAVEIAPDVILPSEFTRLIPARTEPDKTKLKDALKEGRAIDGVRLVQGDRLEIK